MNVQTRDFIPKPPDAVQTIRRMSERIARQAATIVDLESKLAGLQRMTTPVAAVPAEPKQWTVSRRTATIAEVHGDRVVFEDGYVRFFDGERMSGQLIVDSPVRVSTKIRYISEHTN